MTSGAGERSREVLGAEVSGLFEVDEGEHDVGGAARGPVDPACELKDDGHAGAVVVRSGAGEHGVKVGDDEGVAGLRVTVSGGDEVDAVQVGGPADRQGAPGSAVVGDAEARGGVELLIGHRPPGGGQLGPAVVARPLHGAVHVPVSRAADGLMSASMRSAPVLEYWSPYGRVSIDRSVSSARVQSTVSSSFAVWVRPCGGGR